MKMLLIILAVLGANASADWSDIPSTDFEVAAFPAHGSKVAEQDIETLLKYQATRSSAQCALGRRQQHPTYAAFFSHTEVLDSDLYANTKELGERVAHFSERIADDFKGKFDRKRPYDEDSRIKPCAAKVGGEKSYPSSHAIVATVTSCMLAEIYPDQAPDIEQYGQELGELRVIIGLHHPSDVAAGQKLGQEICARLKLEPDFQKELKALKH